MPVTEILNPKTNWDEDIQDGMGPDFGLSREREHGMVFAQPIVGAPDGRIVAGQGHLFTLSWLNRSWRCVQRIKQFAEQYMDGYFTLIDWDDIGDGYKGRHYVGRFTSIPKITEQGNDRYDISGLMFQEFTGVEMLAYPGNWERDAIDIFARNDTGKKRAATVGAWTFGEHVGVESTTYTLDSPDAGACSMTIEYFGYGFQLWMMKDASSTNVEVQVDGVVLDVFSLNDETEQLAMITQQGRLPLDFHRVTLRPLSNVVEDTNDSDPLKAKFFKLRVMR